MIHRRAELKRRVANRALQVRRQVARRQRIERRSNILMRELVTAGQLKRVPRTENNPHGLLIVNWRTLLNKDIEQKTKINY